MDPFIGEIRPVGFNFAPVGWAICAGQIMAISQNTALFSLLGTTYGGNGVTTFALPDLQGRVPLSDGQGPGLSDRLEGEQGGQPYVTLLPSEMPPHRHDLEIRKGPASSPNPVGKLPARTANPVYGPVGETLMANLSVTESGGSQPHNNLQPYLVVNYIIALQGIYPSRP